MSVVIGGVASGTSLDIAGFKQLPHSAEQRFVRRSIQTFFPDKAATFNSRIKSPKSQHWHLAKATQEIRCSTGRAGTVQVQVGESNIYSFWKAVMSAVLSYGAFSLSDWELLKLQMSWAQVCC